MVQMARVAGRPPRGPHAGSESLNFPDLYSRELRTPTSQVEEGALLIWDRTAGVDSSRWVGGVTSFR